MTSKTPKEGSTIFSKNLFKLTIGGGVVFWVITIVTSLLPLAAEYRAAYSNWSPQTVWVASLPMGLIIGCGVSYFLIRFFDKIPTKNPILKSAILSSAALVIAEILVDVPQSFFGAEAAFDALYWFLVGVMFNAVRFLVLGIVIGYLYKRMYGSVKTTNINQNKETENGFN